MTIDERCLYGKKHSWRKVGGFYSKELGLHATKQRCVICGKERIRK